MGKDLLILFDYYNLPEFLREGMPIPVEGGEKLLWYAVKSVKLKKKGESDFKPIKKLDDLLSGRIIDLEKLKKAFPDWEGCYCGPYPNTCGTKNYPGFSMRYDDHCQVKRYGCPPNGRPYQIEHHFYFSYGELLVTFALEGYQKTLMEFMSPIEMSGAKN